MFSVHFCAVSGYLWLLKRLKFDIYNVSSAYNDACIPMHTRVMSSLCTVIDRQNRHYLLIDIIRS